MAGDDCRDCSGTRIAVDTDGSVSGRADAAVPCGCADAGLACLTWNSRQWETFWAEPGVMQTSTRDDADADVDVA